MVPLLERPQLAYTLDYLRSGGVKRAFLACGYLPGAIREYFGTWFDGLRIEYRVEPAPLGTAGAIRFAAQGISRTFLALNGDSLPSASIPALLEFHRAHHAAATILLAGVTDAGGYGLVCTDASGRVREFVEKPGKRTIEEKLVNAGLYVLEPDVLHLVPAGRRVSIERDVFPVLADSGRLYAAKLPGPLIDTGTPAGYLKAHAELLSRRSGLDVHPDARIAAGAELIPPVFIGAGAEVAERARVGPWASVGQDATVGAGAEVRSSAVLPHATVPPEATIMNAIVAPGSNVIGARAPHQDAQPVSGDG